MAAGAARDNTRLCPVPACHPFAVAAAVEDSNSPSSSPAQALGAVDLAWRNSARSPQQVGSFPLDLGPALLTPARRRPCRCFRGRPCPTGLEVGLAVA